MLTDISIIKIGNNHHSVVDKIYGDELAKYNWSYSNGYAMRVVRKKPIMMHRFIMNAPEDRQIDHINGDRLDNRKVNLRVATRSQNQLNRFRQKNNTSGFIGVSYMKSHRAWMAYVTIGGHRKYLGLYKRKMDAINARKKALCLQLS